MIIRKNLGAAAATQKSTDVKGLPSQNMYKPDRNGLNNKKWISYLSINNKRARVALNNSGFYEVVKPASLSTIRSINVASGAGCAPIAT